MAKQWFNYALPTSALSPQLTPENYVEQGPYRAAAFCGLADRTCLIYTYTSSGIDRLPSPFPGGAPGISAKLQAYITANISGPVSYRPTTGKVYLYVRGT